MHGPVVRLLLSCLLAAAVPLGVAATVPAAHAADSLPARDAPDLKSVREAIKVKKYDVALVELRGMEAKYKHPDIDSLMGFVLRKTGDRAQSMTYYRKALAADPGHKGALEYQGELFLELGQIDHAKENLAKLDHLCWFGCEEEDDLKAAIEQASKAK